MIKVYPINFQANYLILNKENNQDEKTINSALEEMKNVQFSKDDWQTVKHLGCIPPFKDGKEAYYYIKDNKIKVKFAELPSKDIHAQWDVDLNTIKLNKIYRNTQNKAILFALSEAIFHETGHAKDKDGDSSIQEELDCLALNAMAHRTIERNYPGVYTLSDANIINNGVSLYSSAYFDADHARLINKMKKSYSHLDLGDEKHPAKKLAKEIKNSIINN